MVKEYSEQYRYGSSKAPAYVRNHGKLVSSRNDVNYEVDPGIASMGRALQGADNLFTHIQIDIDNTKAQAGVTALENSFMTFKQEQSQLKGENGMGVSKNYDEWNQKNIDTITKGMSPVQRMRFERSSSKILSGQKMWADQYTVEQGEVYKNATHIAAVDTSINSYASNIKNIDLAEASKQELKNLAFGESKALGEGPEASRARYNKYVGGGVETGIIKLISEDDLGTARSILAQDGGYLGVLTQDKLKNTIDTRQRAIDALILKQSRINDTVSLKTQTNEHIKNILNLTDGEPLAAQRVAADEFIQKNILDPNMQKMVYSGFNTYMDNKEQAVKNKQNYEVGVFVSGYGNKTFYEQEDEALRLLREGQISLESYNEIEKGIEKGYNTTTRENVEGLNNIKLLIDDDTLKEEEVVIALKQINATHAQMEEGIEYFKIGGYKSGQTSFTMYKSVWNGFYKDKDIPDEFFRQFIKDNPGKMTREQISNYLTFQNTKVSVPGRFYGSNELTIGEARIADNLDKARIKIPTEEKDALIERTKEYTEIEKPSASEIEYVYALEQGISDSKLGWLKERIKQERQQ